VTGGVGRSLPNLPTNKLAVRGPGSKRRSPGESGDRGFIFAPPMRLWKGGVSAKRAPGTAVPGPNVISTLPCPWRNSRIDRRRAEASWKKGADHAADALRRFGTVSLWTS
jgi:hypothetical protein